MSKLPVRTWLALALVSLVAVPFLVGLVFYAAGASLDAAAARDRMIREIDHEVNRWADPAWQAAARGRLAGVGLDVVL